MGDEPVEAPTERGLAASAGAREEDERSLVDGEVYPLQHGGLHVGVRVSETFYIDDAQALVLSEIRFLL